MITRIATIVFFGAFGLAYFIPGFAIVAVIAALIVCIAMVVGA